MKKVQIAIGQFDDVEIYETELTEDAVMKLQDCFASIGLMYSDFSWSISYI